MADSQEVAASRGSSRVFMIPGYVSQYLRQARVESDLP